MTRILYICLLGLLVTGCVSVGNPHAVDDGAAARLASAPHQMRDVLQVLGTPTDRDRAAGPGRSDGAPIHVWTYDYTHVDMTPATYLPLLGPFLGSSPVTSGSLTLRFDATGTLRAVQQGPRFQAGTAPPIAWPDWLVF